MRARLLTGLILLSLSVAACGPVGDQPVFNTKADLAATPLPTPGPGRLVAALGQRILSFDVSPEARWIALGTFRGALIYDLQSLAYVRRVLEAEPVGSVAWSPDGTRLAVGSSKDYGKPFFVGGDSSNSSKAHLTVWDTRVWEILFEPGFGDEMVNQNFRDLAWSPDGRLLAYSTDLGGADVVDTQTGQVLSRQTDFAGTVVDVAWSPDGTRLLATGDMAYGIRRWRLSDDGSVRLFDTRMSNASAVAWSPDGKSIASADYLGHVCLWSANTNKCDGFIQAHRTTFGIAWSPDGSRLASVGGMIRIWDTRSGKLLKAFGQDSAYVFERVEWPAHGNALVTLQTALQDAGKTVLRIWDIPTGSIVVEFRGTQQN